VAYSGGKDSSATVTFVAWAIRTGQVPVPDSLTVLYADTRLELPPLQQTAMQLMGALQDTGVKTRIVLPGLDDRFLIYMLGYGVPPPSNTFRWCTPKIKVEPMHAVLAQLRDSVDEKFLMLTGVRMGESEARDRRIAFSCSRDSGECGQGWFETGTPESVADTLAPLLHWRLCHVYDWLYFDPFGHGYDVHGIASVYGEGEVRTGCMGCPLASRDVALERLVRQPEWERLAPLLELKPLWRELKRPRWRKRKIEPEKRKDGRWGTNVQRMGPLTMEARAYGLERVLDIQERAGVELIDATEESRIREMWELDMWPRKWNAGDADATQPIDALSLTADGKLVRQALLI
jgi:DNA sulfur modification protein DndC